jgi:hypothetical protein
MNDNGFCSHAAYECWLMGLDPETAVWAASLNDVRPLAKADCKQDGSVKPEDHSRA